MPPRSGQPILAERLSVIFQHEHRSINAQVQPPCPVIYVQRCADPSVRLHVAFDVFLERMQNENVKEIPPEALLAPPKRAGAKRKRNVASAPRRRPANAGDTPHLYFTVQSRGGSCSHDVQTSAHLNVACFDADLRSAVPLLQVHTTLSVRRQI